MRNMTVHAHTQDGFLVSIETYDDNIRILKSGSDDIQAISPADLYDFLKAREICDDIDDYPGECIDDSGDVPDDKTMEKVQDILDKRRGEEV